MELSLVIPCYNEEDVLDMFYTELTRVLKDYNKGYELIFVDDGSKDKSKQIIMDLADKDSSVKFISFSRNFGKEAAMLAGLRFSSGDKVGIMDADLQHPPECIIEMVKALDGDEYDIAAARRVDRTGEARTKSFFSRRFYTVMNKLADVDVKEGAQDFRIMKRKVVESIINMPEYHRFSKGIFSWVGFKTKWFEHENVERPFGKSKWKFGGLFRYAMNGIIAFSVVPLRISLVVGIIVSFLGFIQVIELVVSAIISRGENIGSGYATLLSAILIVGGTVLISMGILGEYVARIYIEVKKRPIYIIDETNIT